MLENNRDKTRRIAKNTLLLYVRMIFTMLVSLFTSRIILNILGIEDYGIYNVVGGVVTMFSVFTISLSAAISRFITFELGQNNKERLSVIFSTSVNLLLLLSLIVVLAIEVVGVWFLNVKLNIPASRIDAANWVMQCSIIIFVLNLVSVPYNASIIAHERMGAFAYISILEVALKLVVAYSLYISSLDKLKTYAVLLVSVALVIRLVYGLYCRRHFSECKYRMVYDKSFLKEMGRFTGWNLMGSGVYIFNTQGVNIITNLFFGVSVNAARGIAMQVDGIIKQFVTNFTTALNPQITKSYASDNMDYMFTLVCKGAKYSYFLMFFFVVPFIYETNLILKLWLNNVPEYAPLFLRLTVIGTLCDILGNSTANAAWATGNVRRYYIYVGSVGCLVFPLSYLAFACGLPAYASYLIFIFIYVILIFIKLYIIKGLINFPIGKFNKEVLMRIIPVSVLAFLLPGVFYFNMNASFLRLLLVALSSTLSIVVCGYIVGLEPSERKMITCKLYALIGNKIKKAS
jgi:O-antigen/teichoic acid export membrane protein